MKVQDGGGSIFDKEGRSKPDNLSKGVMPMIQVFGIWCSPERKTQECSRSFGIDVRILNVTLEVNRIHRQKSKKVTV